MIIVNGSVREADGQWLLHWQGEDVPVSSEDAGKLAAQTTLKVPTESLEGSPLDWAVASALGYHPRLQGEQVAGTLLAGGVCSPSYHGFYVVATYSRTHYGEFRPSSDLVQSSSIIDAQRISTEIAGDGWAALKNDCFGSSTWLKSLKAPTRVLAALRCLVRETLGSEVDVPVELLAPQVRLSACHLAFWQTLRERRPGQTARTARS